MISPWVWRDTQVTGYVFDKSRKQEAVKQAQRIRVLQFFERHLSDYAASNPHTSMRFIGLPGRNWTMEKLILKRWPNSNFIGFEKSTKVFEESLKKMPDYRYAVRYIERSNHDKFVICGSHRAKMINSSAGDFLEAARKLSGPLALHQHWDQYYRRADAVFLDFCGCISSEIQKVLFSLPSMIEQRRAVPVVLTIQNGREIGEYRNLEERLPDEMQFGDPLWTRSIVIKQLIEQAGACRFTYDHESEHEAFWRYNCSGANMGIYCGTLRSWRA